MELPEFWRDLTENEVFSNVYFLAIALILAFGTLQTTGTALNTDQPVVSVVSCSMYPGPGEEGLYKGDILFVKGTAFEKISEGDTIVYNVPDRVDFSIAGQDYSLVRNDSNPRPSVDTPVGEVGLLKAGRVSEDMDRASIRVDGEKKAVDEDQSYSFNGINVDIERIDTMPIPVVHRVVKKHETDLETKGINNPSQLEFEQDVRPEQVHGKVFFKIPRVGILKILAMDFVGFNGDRPFIFDRYRPCEVEA
ncbi:hypothetical protein AQV86_02420 [Nanohaloarchaea archaeon SG9]|nr:hypothetical protein AQV86_02420 [Nanohaloarchaea archaeon SG9]